jgi:hypothetical protein
LFSQEEQLGELRRLKEEINNERVHLEQSHQLLEKNFEEARRILKEEINPRNTCRSKLQNFHSSFWNRNQPSPSVDVTCDIIQVSIKIIWVKIFYKYLLIFCVFPGEAAGRTETLERRN